MQSQWDASTDVYSMKQAQGNIQGIQAIRTTQSQFSLLFIHLFYITLPLHLLLINGIN